METISGLWRGRELPIWRFETFAELEAFVDDWLPEGTGTVHADDDFTSSPPTVTAYALFTVADPGA